jgi:hypothetical protein
MKKLLIFIVLVAAGYYAYDNFIKEKPKYQITDSFNKRQAEVSLEAQTITPRNYGTVNGTIKNISEKTLTNIVITYSIETQPSTATISRLEPGQESNFTTVEVMLRYSEPEHILKNVVFDEE